MPITLRGVSRVASTQKVSGIVVDAPTGLALGDFCLIGAAVTSASATRLAILGFTAVTAVENGVTYTFQLFYRVCTGTEGTSFPVIIGPDGAIRDIAIQCIAYTGVLNANPFDPSTPTTSGNQNPVSTMITVSGITTTVDGDQVVWFGHTETNVGGGPATIRPPSGFTAQAPQVNTSDKMGANVGVLVADLAQGTAGATPNVDGSLGVARQNGGIVVGLQPGAISVGGSGMLI